MPSNHLILCHLLLLLPSIFSSIRIFSNESILHIRWPKYWNFNISPSNEYSGLISFRMDWLGLPAVQGTLKSLFQHHSSKCKLVQQLWRTVWRFLKKLEIELPYDPAIPLLGIHTKETRSERDTCTPMFIAALFIIARTWKHPRCPSAVKSINSSMLIFLYIPTLTFIHDYW